VTLDIERLMDESGLRELLDESPLMGVACCRLFASAVLEEAARVCDRSAWSTLVTPMLGPDLGSVKCAHRIRALKPK
jgi:hypothetical protein